MNWIDDVNRGAWLRIHLDPSWRDMHVFVPHGFEAYARVFHPATRDRPADTGTWHGYAGADVFDFEEEKVTWAAVAGTFGAKMHPLAQYHRLLTGAPRDKYEQVIDADGWRYMEPSEGDLDPTVLAAVAGHLAGHTHAPDSGVAGIVEYNGWWNISARHARLFEYPYGQGAETRATAAQLQPTPAPYLTLIDRSYALCKAGARMFTDTNWTTDAPWGQYGYAKSPSILWPDDKAWVLVTEMDYDSTIVAGGQQLITDLVRDPDIEAMIIREGADLSWDADNENRPPDAL
jgi:hypothetical protein